MLPSFVSPTLQLGHLAPTQPPHSFPQGVVSQAEYISHILHLIGSLRMDIKVASSLWYFSAAMSHVGIHPCVHVPWLNPMCEQLVGPKGMFL